MIDLPKHYPKYCQDIKQEADRLNFRFPSQIHGKHSALYDARWVRDSYNLIKDKI
jgi:hypothetical protein